MGAYVLAIGALAAAATVWAPASPAQAALLGDRFICSVAHGYGQGPMVLRIRLTPTTMIVNQPTFPPSEGWWKLMDNNAIGIVAVTGGDGRGVAGYDNLVSGDMIFIRRSTGLIRWTEAGADNQPIIDRVGSCIADAPG